MGKRMHAIEIVKAYKDDSILATLWWDGKEVQCDNKDFLEQLTSGDMKHNTRDGLSFINEVSRRYKNGYLHARRAK